MIVEILLGVGGFNMDRGVELTMAMQTQTSRKVTWEGEVDRIATVELFQESSEGVRPMGLE